ncbi:MAG: hypothetical protein R2822_20550 [Spirosomataceae bacterium]
MKTHSKLSLVAVILLLWLLKSYVALSQNSTEEIVANLEKQQLLLL